MNLTWQTLKPSDLAVYQKYYSMVDSNITDLSFHCRFAWDNVFNIKWTILYDCLIQISDGGGYTYPFMLMPLGELSPEKLEDIVSAVKPVFNENGWTFRIRAIEESMKDLFDNLSLPHVMGYDADSSDYLYDAESLRTLAGKKYVKKRNHWNRFLRLYPDYSYESLSPAIFEECLSLAKTWVNSKEIDINDAEESDYYMIKRLFDNWENLSARGGAIKISGRIAAFSVGSIGRDDIGFIHFEKADTSFDGIYAAINKLVLVNEFPNIRFINREEDLGIPGLRKSKESYFPITKVNKWKLRAE